MTSPWHFQGFRATNKRLIQGDIWHQILHSASLFGSAPWLTCVNEKGTSTTTTYAELAQCVGQTARFLQDTVSAGEKVAVLPANTLDSVVVLLALYTLGAVAVVLNPNEPIARIEAQLAGAEVTLALVVEKFTEPLAVTTLQIEETVRRALAQSPGGNCPFLQIASVAPNKPAVMMYTTGSTAASKAVVLSQYNLLANGHALRAHHPLSRTDVLATALPIYYANAQFFAIVAVLLSGGRTLLFERFDPLSFSTGVTGHSATIINLVPSMLDALLGRRELSLPNRFRYYVSAASALSSASARKAFSRHAVRIVQGYGLTETTNFSTVMPTALSAENYAKLMLESDIPPIGVAIEGNEVFVRSQSGGVAGPGEVGEICIRGHNVMSGYFNNIEETEKAFADDVFHSGDLGYWQHNEFEHRPIFTLVGRSKNVVKVAGEAVSLEELDRLLLKIPGIADAATVAVQAGIYGERPVSAVVLSDHRLTEQSLLRILAVSLSRYKLPMSIKFVPVIPRTANGKVVRAVVRATYFSG